MTRKQTLRSFSLICMLGLSSASVVSAESIAIIDITNDPEYSWTWNEDLNLGYSFIVPAGETVTFNALAVFDVISATPGTGGGSLNSTSHVNALGLNSSHQVGVWGPLDLLVSTTVDPGDPTAASANTFGQWVYSLVPTTTLTAGTYTIGAFFAGNSDPVMLQQTAFSNGAAVYSQGQYLYDSTFGRPNSNFAPNEQQYFGPTLMAVPDGGATLVLLGGAMMGLAALRRRRKS